LELSTLSDEESDGEVTEDEEAGLTQRSHRKRRRRKQKDILSPDEAEAERKMAEGIARSTLIRNIVINTILILLWYTFSICISVYNKWMFSAGKNGLDFHFPLFTTSLHMLVQFSLASLVLFFMPRFRPQASADSFNLEHQHAHKRSGAYSHLNDDEDDAPPPPPAEKPRLMTKTFYFTRIAPCGTATALDIGLGNFSLRFISLTFFTMCKSSVLAFVLIFAFIFRLEKPTWRLCAIILLMTAGVIMMVAGETAFNALGFMLVMTASFCSGFRWSLTQILLLRNPATSNPFASIFFLTPVMFVALVVLALPIEGPAAIVKGVGELMAAKGAILGTLIMLFPGSLAFMMVAAEFALLKRSSVVTLSVCGIFKEVLTISAASATFGDELSPINVSGLVVTIASIACYNWLKYSKMRKDAKKEAHEIVEDEVASVKGRNSLGVDEGDFAIGRESTSTARSGLMRDNLTLTTPYVHDDGPRHAPSKRPEDLE
jgi:solute carrier family 35 protein C2